MDPAPTPPPSTTTTTDPPLPPLPTTKIRLMCSYGGHIVPRPHNKSLYYSGGDTRIVSVDRRTTASSVSSLVSHLSRTLYSNRLFHLKYQLPNEDLDSLISITTDEDLHNMLEEHDSVVGSPTHSRVRLFLFPVKSESLRSVLLDLKAESWFSDALKSTRINQKGRNDDAGLDCLGFSDSSGEGQVESGEGRGGLELGSSSLPESMVLETSSSFGSTNSSASMSNLPPIGAHGEDGVVNLQDTKVKVASPGPIESDHSVASAAYLSKTGIFQESLIPVASGVSSDAFDSESILSDPSSVTQMMRTIRVSGYQLSHQSDLKQQQQEVRYIHTGASYIPQYPAGPLPVSSYYPVYHPPLHQQHGPYQLNQLYPIYLVPTRPSQTYNMPTQGNLIYTATIASGRPPLHPPSAVITPPVVDKEVTAAPPIPEPAVSRTAPAATPLVNVPSIQNQQLVNPPESYDSSLLVATASVAVANYDDEFDDDLTYAQIYKSQPPAPALPPQYQTMTKAAGVLLSEASTKLHTDNDEQQVGT